MPVYNGGGVRLRILSLNDLRELGIYYSRVHIHRLVKAGKFPAPIKVGQNRIGWVESEIDEWLNAKIAERDAKEAA
jgi:prophage regulatory protein